MLIRNFIFFLQNSCFLLGLCSVVLLKMMGEKRLLELVGLIEPANGKWKMSKTSLKMLPLYFKWNFNILNSSKYLKS